MTCFENEILHHCTLYTIQSALLPPEIFYISIVHASLMYWSCTFCCHGAHYGQKSRKHFNFDRKLHRSCIFSYNRQKHNLSAALPPPPYWFCQFGRLSSRKRSLVIWFTTFFTQNICSTKPFPLLPSMILEASSLMSHTQWDQTCQISPLTLSVCVCVYVLTGSKCHDRRVNHR